MFEWYADLSRPAKIGAALVVLAISAGLWTAGTFWPWGWAVGFVMLVAAFLIDD